MAIDYSFPTWMLPKHAPWEALVAGVQAGSQIAANRQRGRALAAQTQHQAFQDRVLHEKFQADTRDLQTLQEWWPTFASAEGEALQSLKVPPLKNAQLWNQITLEVGKKRQQAAASELASGMAGLNLETPEGQADYYDLVSKAARTGLPFTMEQIQAPVFKAQELSRLKDSAAETKRYHDLLAGKTPQKVNLAEAQRLERIADALETIDPEEAKRYREDANVMRASIPTAAGVVRDVSKPTGAVQTDVQRQALSGETAVTRGIELLENLTPADVGVRGVFNEVVVNKWLAQAVPSLAKNKVTDTRTLMRAWREQLLKSVKPDSQLNAGDVKRLMEAFPEMGIDEQFDHAKTKISRWVDEVRRTVRTNAEATKSPVPDWTWTKDEVVQKFESGEWDKAKALDILVKYHPDE